MSYTTSSQFVTKSKYKLTSTREVDAKSEETHIRISNKKGCSFYINLVANLLLREKDPYKEITLSGIGTAIGKAILVSEIIRRRIPKLY
jgi:DNA-binding protein